MTLDSSSSNKIDFASFSSLVTTMASLNEEKKDAKIEKLGKIDFKDGKFFTVTKKPSTNLSKVVEQISQTISVENLKASSKDLEILQAGCTALSEKVLKDSKGRLNSIMIMIIMALRFRFTPSSVKTQLALDNIQYQLDRKLKLATLQESIQNKETQLETLQQELAQLKQDQTNYAKIKSGAKNLGDKFGTLTGTLKKGAAKLISNNQEASPVVAQDPKKLTPIESKKLEVENLEKSIATDKAELELALKPIDTKETLRFKRAVLFGVGLGQREKLIDVLKSLNLDPKELASRAGMNEGDTVGSTIEKNIHYLKDLKVQIPQESVAQKLVQETIERSDRILTPKPTDFGGAITQELKKMKAGEFLFAPIGCINHDTLMVFTKLEEGSVSISYYNTGLGSQVLPTTRLKSILVGATGVKFNPIDLNQSDQALTTLLNQLHAREEDTEMTEINQILFSKNSILKDGQTISTNRVQVDGTCSFSSLLLGIEQVIKTKTQSETAMKSFERDLHYRVSQDVASSLHKDYLKKGGRITKEVLVTEHLLNHHNNEFLKGISPPKPKYRTKGSAREDLVAAKMIYN